MRKMIEQCRILVTQELRLKLDISTPKWSHDDGKLTQDIAEVVGLLNTQSSRAWGCSNGGSAVGEMQKQTMRGRANWCCILHPKESQNIGDLPMSVQRCSLFKS